MPDAYDRLLDSFASEPPMPPASAAPEWEQFAPDSGSLNIPRASMPQIKSEHRGAMVQYLKGRGITHSQEEVAPGTLKPSQAEWSPAKVDKARGFAGPQRSILVSSDDHVVDGHHQWLASRDDAPDKPIPAIRLNAPIQQLLIEAARFPSSDVDKSSTLAAASSGMTQEAQKTPPRDAYDAMLDGLETSNAPARRPAASGAVAAPRHAKPAAPPSSSWRDMTAFVEGHGFEVTSDVGGKHNAGSPHYDGRAVDVRTRDKSPEEVERLMRRAHAAGFTVRDERTRPAGQAVWDGEHVHLEMPDGAPAPDEYDSLLADLADPVDAPVEAAAPDEYDRLLDSLADADPVEVVNADSRNVASPVSMLPPPDSLNPYDAHDRAQRDTAASARVRAVTVPLSRSLADYSDSASLMADAYREGARSLNIDPAFVEEWIKNHPGDMRIIGDVNAPDATPADLLGSSVHDARRNTVTLNLGGLADLERDYKAQRSTASRAVDWATDDTHTAGEKFLDVAAPVAGAVGRAGDLATRPLQATSTALWSLARKHSPTEAAKDAWTELRTGETPTGAGNWLAEKTRESETLKRINPNLPGMAGGVVEMLTDPANLAPLGMMAKGGQLLRGLKGVRAVEEALMASRDARALEFFNAGGRVLKIEAAAGEAAAAAGDDVPRLLVTLKDADGVEHTIDTSHFYANGEKPKLVSRRAGEDIEGVGLERDGDTGRVFHNGRPQDFVMDSETGLRASPVGGAAGRGGAAAVPESALVPETPATLSAQVEAMKAGRRAVVVVTPDDLSDVSQKVIVPKGMRSFGTPEGGRIIYNPSLADRADVIRRMDDGTLGELMGHVEPKPAAPEIIVVAKDPQTGTELQSSYVSSAEKADEQAAAFAEQHPGAIVEVGGAELEREVLTGRTAANGADQALPLTAMTPRERIRKLARDVQDVVNITKAIPASFDNSALMGQGAIIAGARPSLIPGAVSDSARSAMSPTRFEAFKRKLVTHPNQDLRESSGLYLASIGTGSFSSRLKKAADRK